MTDAHTPKERPVNQHPILDRLAESVRELREAALQAEDPILSLELRAGADAVSAARNRLEAAEHAARALGATDPMRYRSRIEFRGLVIDRDARTVRLNGQPRPASRMEFGLLSALAEEPYRVFTKDELYERLWGTAMARSSRTLDSHACRVRQLLGGKPWVHNVWGQGYSLRDPAEAPASQPERHLQEVA